MVCAVFWPLNMPNIAYVAQAFFTRDRTRSDLLAVSPRASGLGAILPAGVAGGRLNKSQ